MAYSIGQKVVFLHETGQGVVRSINEKGKLIIEDESGFDKEYFERDIAPIHSNDYQISDDEIILKDASEKVVVNHVEKEGGKNSDGKRFDVWEIDLHVEEITDSHAGLTNAEIMRKQMSALKIFVKQAQAKSIKKLVIIHGVGQGVLKHEVRQYLTNIDLQNFYDADFGEYGKGATAVELTYKY